MGVVTETIDWPPRRPAAAAARLLLLVAVPAVLFGGGTALSYYVDALWFGSLGYADVFWTTLNLQAAVFSAFAPSRSSFLYGSFLASETGAAGRAHRHSRS